MPIRTELMRRLRLAHPIIQAPMAGGRDTPDLVAASTMSTPPAKPDAKRQAKNQAKASGAAQAKKAAVAVSIMARSAAAADRRAAIRRASSAPAR